MINELHHQVSTRMDQALDHVRQELATLRTGRANPRMVDHVKVDEAVVGEIQGIRNFFLCRVGGNSFVLKLTLGHGHLVKQIRENRGKRIQLLI